MNQAGDFPPTAQSLACPFAASGGPWGAMGPPGLGSTALKTVAIKHNWRT